MRQGLDSEAWPSHRGHPIANEVTGKRSSPRSLDSWFPQVLLAIQFSLRPALSGGWCSNRKGRTQSKWDCDDLSAGVKTSRYWGWGTGWKGSLKDEMPRSQRKKRMEGYRCSIFKGQPDIYSAGKSDIMVSSNMVLLYTEHTELHRPLLAFNFIIIQHFRQWQNCHR